MKIETTHLNVLTGEKIKTKTNTNETPRFTELPDEQMLYTVPPVFVANMVAVDHATQDKSGAINLHYQDGTVEQRLSDKDICQDFKSFFELVSFVQGGRSDDK